MINRDIVLPQTDIRSRFGASIGSASHKRRSSQFPHLLKRQESHDGFFPTLMEKIRQGSHKIFHHHHSREGSEEAPPITSSTASGAYGHGKQLSSRDSTVRDKMPLPPKPDITGIYEAMTGTRLVVSRCRNGACSEDNRPHVCENDYLTPVPTASLM
ncbi:hypothetical protein BGZ63DRAFT_378668 [Mariannaea sp. PMI_226]|nr:hypothetical protein BGZ63DRAFT_378668 [Mariannaea sp. PMI_226]